MTFDSLIAVAALAIAAYQIMPRPRQLDVSLRFRLPEWTLIGFALLLILYLQLYPVFRSLGLTPKLGLARVGLSPYNVSFVVLLLTTVTVAWRLWRYRLKPRHVHRFAELVDELHDARELGQLTILLERHCESLIAITAHGETRTDRFRDRIAVSRDARGLLVGIRRRAAALLPESSEQRVKALRTLARLLSSQPVAAEIALRRPNLGLELLEVRQHEVFAFLDHYLRALLEDPTSALHREVDQISSWSSGEDIGVHEEMPLLFYLFGNAERARELSAWSPVGDRMLEELDRYRDRPRADDPFNQQTRHGFENFERKRLLVFRGLDYFDIMVTRALVQGVEWHMWLYYLPIMAEKVLGQYERSKTRWSVWSGEWSYYDRLLEYIIWLLCDWIRGVERLPPDQANAKLRDVLPDHENGNIVKSSMLALGQVLGMLSKNAEVPKRLKEEWGHVAFGRVFLLRRNEERRDYATALLNALIAGGYSHRPDPQIGAWLTDVFASYDKIPHDRDDVDWVEEILKAAAARHSTDG